MAKRRRLDMGALTSAPETKSITRLSGAPPIAEVTGQTAALAAGERLAAELEAARTDGRLAQRIPLEAIAADHLVRDRLVADDEDMAALMGSIRTHGQRTPLEVVETGAGAYGLISGFRRLTALLGLSKETGEERFETALAVIRQPADAGAAYVAMVEENEIRVGLSYYERARIAAKAAERGAFPDPAAAVDALFASGSKAKRSKIRSFLAVHEALGDALRFPAALPERLGLAVAQGLKAGQGSALRTALAKPAPNAEAEARALTAALKAAPAPKARVETLAPGIEMARKGTRLTLSGPGVTDDLVMRLRQVLRGA